MSKKWKGMPEKKRKIKQQIGYQARFQILLKMFRVWAAVRRTEFWCCRD